MGYLAITLIGIFCLMYLAFCEGKETNKQSEWHFTNIKKPIIGKYIENQDGHIALYLGDDKYVDNKGNGVNVTAWRYVDDQGAL